MTNRTGSHTAEALLKFMRDTLREFGISDAQLAAITSDNESAIKSARRVPLTCWAHSWRSQRMPGLSWFCTAHTLNLSVVAALEAPLVAVLLEKVLRAAGRMSQQRPWQVSALITYIKRSNLASEAVASAEEILGLPDLKVLRACPTRYAHAHVSAGHFSVSGGAPRTWPLPAC